jgi:hypothetical protein
MSRTGQATTGIAAIVHTYVSAGQRPNRVRQRPRYLARICRRLPTSAHMEREDPAMAWIVQRTDNLGVARFQVRYRDPAGTKRTAGTYASRREAKAGRRVDGRVEDGTWINPAAGRVTFRDYVVAEPASRGQHSGCLPELPRPALHPLLRPSPNVQHQPIHRAGVGHPGVGGRALVTQPHEVPRDVARRLQARCA